MTAKTFKRVNNLAQAISELAAAIRNYKKCESSQLNAENRRVQANNIMAWANLVFSGLVISQIFLDNFNTLIAVVGGVGFLLAYLMAARILKGGEPK